MNGLYYTVIGRVTLYIPDITMASFGPHVWKGIFSDLLYAFSEITLQFIYYEKMEVTSPNHFRSVRGVQ